MEEALTSDQAAVAEGRVTYDNIKKFVLYLLACNSSEIYVMLFSVCVGFPVPFTPIMILWANLIVDVPPAMALVSGAKRGVRFCVASLTTVCQGVDFADVGVMKRLPRDPHARILGWKTCVVLFFQGALISGFCNATLLSHISCRHEYRNGDCDRLQPRYVYARLRC